MTTRTISLLLANLTTGLAAGVFVLYAHTIMPGLRSTDDRTFVTAFQAVDRAIINPWFMGSAFLGAAVATSAASILSRGSASFRWMALATAAYAVTVVITLVVHVPLNDGIKAVGAPDQVADLAAVRARFHERRWVAWNLVRSGFSVVAFVASALALSVGE